jgi:hypothetical protein
MKAVLKSGENPAHARGILYGVNGDCATDPFLVFLRLEETNI